MELNASVQVTMCGSNYLMLILSEMGSGILLHCGKVMYTLMASSSSPSPEVNVARKFFMGDKVGSII